jgi:hypothetical protein
MNAPETCTLANSTDTLEGVAKLKKTIQAIKASGLEVPYEMTFQQGYVTYRALNFSDKYQFFVDAPSNGPQRDLVEANWVCP